MNPASTRGLSLLLVIFSLIAATSAAAQNYRIETFAEGIAFPWSIAFLPDGSYLLTERDGRLRRLSESGTVSEPIAGVPPVFARSQAGLFDVLPDPDFVETGVIYLSYAHGDDRANTPRVARARLIEDRLEDLEVIFSGTPKQRTAAHYGGRLAFLPDGTLLFTTGDGFNYREDAQRLDNTRGKTIRIRPDGGIPADNPFVGNPDALDSIWTYGHRNAQGLVVTPDGRVFQHEHGPQGGDELNRLQTGRNYGWPVITHGIDYTGARISPFTEYPGMEQPLVDWTPSTAPSGLTYYDGEAFPDWRGQLFVGALAERSIRRVSLTADGAIDHGKVFEEISSRVRDVRTGPDGFIYVLTDEADGKVLRIRPAQ
ncbi:MAG: PQQ-dependent sugar dehydrogenase [Gammaproteobacteria bacterium]|nr:PQQ-dependent sugar dehydrogenase [Gammaproteobacteria bacterium]